MRVALIIIGITLFAIGMGYAMRIEQTAGYYACSKCGHRYIPTYGRVFLAMHVNRTRYMKCPQCHQWSWQKKVLSKK